MAGLIPVAQQRYLLFQSSDHAAIVAEQSRLEDLYKREFKRALPVELYFSSWGSRPATYGITAYWEEPQRADMEFLIANVTPSTL